MLTGYVQNIPSEHSSSGTRALQIERNDCATDLNQRENTYNQKSVILFLNDNHVVINVIFFYICHCFPSIFILITFDYDFKILRCINIYPTSKCSRIHTNIYLESVAKIKHTNIVTIHYIKL